MPYDTSMFGQQGNYVWDPMKAMGQLYPVALMQNALMQNQMMQTQFAARNIVGGYYNDSIDPQTGELDTNKLTQLVASNPNTRWLAAEVNQQALARQAQQYDIQSKQAALLYTKQEMIGERLAPLINKPDLNVGDITNVMAGLLVDGKGLFSREPMINTLMSLPTNASSDQLRNLVMSYSNMTEQGRKALEPMLASVKEVDAGDRINFIGNNPRLSSFGQVVQSVPKTGLTPAEAAKEITGPFGPYGRQETITVGEFARRRGGIEIPQGYVMQNQPGTPFQGAPTAPGASPYLYTAQPGTPGQVGPTVAGPGPSAGPSVGIAGGGAVGGGGGGAGGAAAAAGGGPQPMYAWPEMDKARAANADEQTKLADIINTESDLQLRLAKTRQLMAKMDDATRRGLRTGPGTEFGKEVGDMAEGMLRNAANVYKTITGNELLSPADIKRIGDNLAGNDRAALDEFGKYALQGAMEQLMSQLQGALGSRVNMVEFQKYIQANPNWDTQPQAIEDLYNFFTKTAQFHRARQEFYNQKIADANFNPMLINAAWTKHAIDAGWFGPRYEKGKATGTYIDPSLSIGATPETPPEEGAVTGAGQVPPPSPRGKRESLGKIFNLEGFR